MKDFQRPHVELTLPVPAWLGKQDKEKQPERWARWVHAISRKGPGNKKWEPRGKYVYLCSEHFITGKQSSDPEDLDYVPSIFAHKPPKTSTPKRTLPYERSATKRRRLASIENVDHAAACTASPLEELKQPSTPPYASSPKHLGISEFPDELQFGNDTTESSLLRDEMDMPSENVSLESQAEVSAPHVSTSDIGLQRCVDKSERSMLYDEMDLLRSEKESLQTKLEESQKRLFMSNYDPVYLKDNDKTCKYFTGLTWFVFNTLCSFLVPCVKSSKNNLPISNQLMMVLVKLRLNLQFEFVSHQTGLSIGTISTTFWKWIDLIHIKMGFLISWPDREVMAKTNPPVFKQYFPRLTGIMDCFEIFTDRPVKLKPRAQMYSNYKKHSTVKFLVVSNPLGAVTFLSRAWGGRASDNEIVKNSDFINPRLHHPRDQLLADRGFTLKDEFAAACGAELVIPAFTKGKKQLSAKDVETTRSIAHIRIHIERVIGLMKNRYSILSGPLPISFLNSRKEQFQEQKTIGKFSRIDKLVRVCAILVNLSPGIVYKE